MKYLTVFLLILLLNSCNKAKTLTYEEGLKNCDQVLAEKKKKNPNEFSTEAPECLLGAQIPEFEAYTIDGKKINRESLKGKLTIINFWFTTCAPCVAEIPGLNSIVYKFGTDKLNYIAIGRDNSQDIQDFLIKNPWSFEQVCFSIILKSSNCITQIIKITLITVYDHHRNSGRTKILRQRFHQKNIPEARRKRTLLRGQSGGPEKDPEARKKGLRPGPGII